MKGEINLNKLFNKLAIIDGSYFLHRSLHQPDLWELKNDKTGERTGGIYGFLRIFNSEIKNLYYYPIVVWDSGLAERRLHLYPNYKHNLDKNIESVARRVLLEDRSLDEVLKENESRFGKSDEEIDSVEAIRKRVQEQLSALSKDQIKVVDKNDDYMCQYLKQSSQLIEILDSLGIPSIKVNGWEGDDLMTILTRISKESVILTDDKDLQQLVEPTVKNYRPMAKQWVTFEGLGDWTPRDLCIVKAIVGDGSDNIPSVTQGEERKYSLGAGRAIAVSRIIRENNEDPDKYLKVLEDLNKNYYKGFIKNHDRYLRNMKLVDLSLVETEESIVRNMEITILDRLGKGNLFEVLGKLGSLGINSLDTNGLLSRIILLAPTVKV